MNGIGNALEQSEQDILSNDVSDEALERVAAGGMAEAANPTLPSALVCIPFDVERR